MKTYITHTTENYEECVINLATSLSKYSKHPLIVYTVDYDGSPELRKLALCIRLDLNVPPPASEDLGGEDGLLYVNRHTYRTYLALSSKIDCMLHTSKELGIEEWVYLDGDCIANINIDSIFNYSHLAIDYPIATLGPFPFVCIRGGDIPPKAILDKHGWRGNPYHKEDGTSDYTACLEWPLMEFFGLEPIVRENKSYKTTNILLGTNKNIEFLQLWKDVKDLLPKITKLNWYAPFHEETIYNVLTYKYPYHHHMPKVYINIDSAEGVTHYLNHEFGREYNSGIDIDPQTGKPMKEFLSYPSDKDDIKVFHGEKRKSEAKKIFNILDRLKNE